MIIKGVVEFINTTPHRVVLMDSDGRIYSVPPCGTLVNATPMEVPAGTFAGAELVRTTFVGNDEGWEFINSVRAKNPNAIILGSVIAAQAYPGQVFAMVPCKGFERVPPAEKLMQAEKFIVF